MADSSIKNTLKTACILCLYVVGFGALMVLTNEMLKDRIAANTVKSRLNLVKEVLPSSLMSRKDVSFRCTLLDPDPLLGTRRPKVVYRIQTGQGIEAVVILAVAPGGYGGDIHLMIALAKDLSILGVRVLEHKETPGIGDYVAKAPSAQQKTVWLSQFNQKSLQTSDSGQWKITKDGGRFGYMAGATVSPRAIVKAVHQALLYAKAHRQNLFEFNPDKPKPG